MGFPLFETTSENTSCHRSYCDLRVLSCHASETGFVILVTVMMLWDAGLGNVCTGKNDGEARRPAHPKQRCEREPVGSGAGTCVCVCARVFACIACSHLPP